MMTFDAYMEVLGAVFLTAFTIVMIYCAVILAVAFTTHTYELFWRKKDD